MHLLELGTGERSVTLITGRARQARRDRRKQLKGRMRKRASRWENENRNGTVTGRVEPTKAAN